MAKPAIIRRDDGSGNLPVGDLQSIPGIGRSLAWDLIDLGFHRVEELRGADPETMYRHLNLLRGVENDRCVLYAFRCAVYFAETVSPDPEHLKWWNWTDERARPRPPTKAGRRSREANPRRPAIRPDF